MNLRTLIRRNRRFHRRSNFALLLGVAVGTAVLTGALMVGDSLRGSLRERVLQRLNGVKYAMVPGRFFLLMNQGFAQNVIDENAKGELRYEPAILIPATVEAKVSSQSKTTADVTLIGTISREWRHSSSDFPGEVPPYTFSWRIWELVPAFRGKAYPVGDLVISYPAGVSRDKAVLTRDIAKQLGLGNGQDIVVRVPKVSQIARDSVLAHKDENDLYVSLPLTVSIDDECDVSQLSLTPGLAPPRNIVVDLHSLQEALRIPGQKNAILVTRGQHALLQTLFMNHLRLTDFGLMTVPCPSEGFNVMLRDMDRDNSNSLEPREYRRRVAEITIQQADSNNDKTLTREELQAYYRKKGYFALESDSLLLSPAAEKAALVAAGKLGLKAAPTMVYLANSISDGTNAIPYSVVAALDPQLPVPLGPFLDPKEKPLADDEILLVDWPESPLSVKPGDKVTLTYFLPESEGKATEATATFRVRGKVPLAGVAADPDITPAFPGITDKLSLGEWDPPFPYDNSKIKKADEDYWDKYRATPKAYINSAAGRQLFGSRFGNATSIRIAAKSPETMDEDAKNFDAELLKQINPADFGFVFEDVRARALQASQGGTDFGGLFLGFSFFLIAAALLLIVLLVRLNIDRRASETGLLLATGYRLHDVRRLLLRENLRTTLWGAAWGLLLAIGYCWSMLKLLTWLWPEGGIGSFLELHVEPTTMAIGYGATVLAAMAAVWWGLRTLNNISCVQLLRGTATHTDVTTTTRRWPILVCGLLGIVAIISGLFVHGHEARAGTFFSGGGLLLVAGLLLFRTWLRHSKSTTPTPSLWRLGIQNAARNPSRSLLTAGLLAAASFLLVAVESFRRSPEADFALKSGGSGGFQFVATSDLPIYQDPNDPTTGQKELLEVLQREYQKDPATKDQKLNAATKLLEATTFVPLRVRAGDDAGCRNLYRPDKPRLLGVPKRFIERGGFHFAKTMEKTNNPWELLNRNDGDAIPVFGEANTVAWMLHKSLGDTLDVTDSKGNKRQLRIVGLLQDSIFQGELVMAESRLLELYPETSGYGMMLIETPADKKDETRSVVELAFAERGLMVTPSIDRLRSYLAVENTYLSTFQVLGALGLLLGVCGLAVVMLRSMWERRSEMALLRAIGFQARDLRQMVLAEVGFLLSVGLGIGIIAAGLSVVPQTFGGQAVHVPMAAVIGMLLAIVVTGVLAGLWSLRGVVRAPIVPALRAE